MNNYKPFVERNCTNVISKIEAVRDDIHQYFLEACDKQKVDALVFKSHPFSPTVWVKFECWVPLTGSERLTDRSSVVIYIRPREFHRFEYEMDMEVQDGRKRRRYLALYHFSREQADKTVQYLLRRTRSRRLSFSPKRVRTSPLQIWRPKNKLKRLHKDTFRIMAGLLSTGGVALMITGVPPIALLGMVIFVLGALIAFTNHRRRSYLVSSGKPLQEPRRMVRLDSWQTLVYELGGEVENVRSALKVELQKARLAGFSLQDENIWYWGVDGTEERNQTVVTFRRAIGFVHLYNYSNDLYVGWDAHVNCGSWVETEVGTGVDPESKKPACLKSIVAGWHSPNEYDITDTNCLIEWVHGAVTRVVKRFLAEHKIDQEIDFQILRGERQGIEGRQEPPTEQRRPRFGRFRLSRES